jgi:hypothetical protein
MKFPNHFSFNRITFSIFAVITFLLASCHDDEVKLDEKTKLLTQNNWEIYTTVYTAPSGATLSTGNSCENDNVYSYSTKGSYSFNAGSDVCGQTSVNGKWTWNNDKTIILLTIGGSTKEYPVEELSGTKLALNNGNFNVDITGDEVPEMCKLVITYQLIE